MFNVYLENRYRCRAVVIWNFPVSDLYQYIQLHDNRVTRVQFCKRASSVTNGLQLGRPKSIEDLTCELQQTMPNFDVSTALVAKHLGKLLSEVLFYVSRL